MKNTVVNIDKAPGRGSKGLSQRQLAANRANARKSTGPVTPEGKAAVRFNGLKHGLTSAVVCLPGEDIQDYEALRAEYHRTLRPRNILEHDLVDAIAVARWRENRVIRAENGLIRDSIAHHRADIEDTYASLSQDVENALALKALADESSILEQLDRCERRLRRNSAAAMRQLAEYRRNFPPSTDSITYVPFDGTSENVPAPHTEPNQAAPVGNATAPNTVVVRPKAPDAEPAAAPSDGDSAKVQTKAVPKNEHLEAAPAQSASQATRPSSLAAAPEPGREKALAASASLAPREEAAHWTPDTGEAGAAS